MSVAQTTSHRSPAAAPPPSEITVIKKLSRLDRFLPLWIALAMAVGLVLGAFIPSLNDGLAKLQIGTVSLPIAIGLLVMMYPVLAKVRYEDIGRMSGDRSDDECGHGELSEHKLISKSRSLISD